MRAELMALQARYGALLALLPTDPDELDDLDPDDFLAMLDDVKLITAEMESINSAQKAILDELARRQA